MGRLKKDDSEGRKRIEEIKKKCEEIGITYGSYAQRIRNGWTQEEALTAPQIDMHKAFYLYNGESARQYVKNHGGSYSTFMYHIKTKSIEEAMQLTLNHKGNKKYYRDGDTLAKWCEKNGKNYYTEYVKLKKCIDKSKNK